jgi:hypothetical protein
MNCKPARRSEPRMRITALLLISVLLASCTPAVITKQDYQNRCQEAFNLQNTLTGSVYYQGTRDGYDYFQFEPFGSLSHRARVKEGEVFLKKRFPFSTEKKNWVISYPDWSGLTAAETNVPLPVVYEFFFINMPNAGKYAHDYGPDQVAGQKARQFLGTHSAVLPGSKVTHVDVRLMPFSHSRECQRLFDLRLVEAKLDVFITWMADGKPEFLPAKIEQIPLENIEGTLRLMCAEVGIPKLTILRSFGWKDSHTNSLPENTAGKPTAPQQ